MLVEHGNTRIQLHDHYKVINFHRKACKSDNDKIQLHDYCKVINFYSSVAQKLKQLSHHFETWVLILLGIEQRINGSTIARELCNYFDRCFLNFFVVEYNRGKLAQKQQSNSTTIFKKKYF
jgi:hypothetical protein